MTGYVGISGQPRPLHHGGIPFTAEAKVEDSNYFVLLVIFLEVYLSLK